MTATRQLGVRSIALLEAAKAFVALMAATGIALHVRLRPIVMALGAHLHLNPARDRPLALLHALGAEASAHLRLIAVGVLVYAALRIVEAVGLWHGRGWALWLGALSAAVYLPFELVRLVERPSALTGALLCLNGAVAFYLANRVAAARPDGQQHVRADRP